MRVWGHRACCKEKIHDHEHGSLYFLVRSGPYGHQFVDKTKPHDPQGWSQTENALFLFTATHGALHEARSALFVAIILFKTVHYWTAILPE
jgi:hypothetical protein